MKYLYRLFVLSLLFSINLAAQVPAKIIPSFTFHKLDQTAFTNKNLQAGKKILFVFFDTECEHCLHAIEYINQHTAGLKDAAVYLLTLDSKEKITGFMAKHGTNLMNKQNITLLQDTKNEFIQKFGPRKYPSIFLYSPKKELILYDDDEQNLFKFLQKIKEGNK